MKNRLLIPLMGAAVLLLGAPHAQDVVLRCQVSAAGRLISGNPEAPTELYLAQAPEKAVHVTTGLIKKYVDVLTFHVKSTGAIGASYAESSTRPVIISDDGWIDQTAKYGSMVETDVMKKALNAAIDQDKGGCFEHVEGTYKDGEPGDFDISKLPTGEEIEVRNRLSALANAGPPNPDDGNKRGGTRLKPGGTLKRSENRLIWRSSAGEKEIKTLVGYSTVGAITGTADTGEATYNSRYAAFLQVLSEYHINYTRVFLVHPWSRGRCAAHPFKLSPGTLFVRGSNCVRDKNVEICGTNPKYLDSLLAFVQKASDLGIVVHVTLFDKCGLGYQTYSKREGCQTPADNPWEDNPYNIDRSDNACAAARRGFNSTRDETGCLRFPRRFVDLRDKDVQWLHNKLIQDVVNKVGSHGNVMFEIMNEPWGGLFSDGSGYTGEDQAKYFHCWVKERVRYPEQTPVCP